MNWRNLVRWLTIATCGVVGAYLLVMMALVVWHFHQRDTWLVLTGGVILIPATLVLFALAWCAYRRHYHELCSVIAFATGIAVLLYLMGHAFQVFRWLDSMGSSEWLLVLDTLFLLVFLLPFYFSRLIARKLEALLLRLIVGPKTGGKEGAHGPSTLLHQSD